MLRGDDAFEQCLEGRLEVCFIVDEERVLREEAGVERTRFEATCVAAE